MKSFECRPSVVAIRLGSPSARSYACPTSSSKNSLDHQVVHAVPAGFDHRETVMTGVEVEEVGLERPQRVVAQPEAEKILIERQHAIDPLDVHHNVTHAERTGPKAGDGPAGAERIRGDLGAVERFEHVPAGSSKRMISWTRRSSARAAASAARATPAASSREASASSAAPSATSQPRNAAPSPPSAFTTTRWRRSSIRNVSVDRLRSTSCMPRNLEPNSAHSSTSLARMPSSRAIAAPWFDRHGPPKARITTDNRSDHGIFTNSFESSGFSRTVISPRPRAPSRRPARASAARRRWSAGCP